MFCALGRPAASPNLDGKCGRWPHFPSRFPRQRVAIFLPPTDGHGARHWGDEEDIIEWSDEILGDADHAL